MLTPEHQYPSSYLQVFSLNPTLNSVCSSDCVLYINLEEITGSLFQDG